MYYPGMMPMQPVLYLEYVTQDGRPYFYNTITKTTQWEAPPLNSMIVKAPSQKTETKQVSFFSTLNSLTSGGEKQSSGGYVRSAHY